MEQETYHEKLKKEMDEYVHLVYAFTKKFPKEEIYGVTSQIRRASLSVILNYFELRNVCLGVIARSEATKQSRTNVRNLAFARDSSLRSERQKRTFRNSR